MRMGEDPAIADVRFYGLEEIGTASFRRMNRKTTIPFETMRNREVHFPVRRKSVRNTEQAGEKKEAGCARSRIRMGRIHGTERSPAEAFSRRLGLGRHSLTAR